MLPIGPISLKTRIALGITAIYFVMTGLALWLQVRAIRHEMTTHIISQQFGYLELVAAEIDQKLLTRKHGISILGSQVTPEMLRHPQQLQQLLDTNRALLVGFDALRFVQADGRIIASTSAADVRAQFDTNFIHSVASSTPEVSDPFFSRLENKPMVAITMPVSALVGNGAANGTYLLGLLALDRANFLGQIRTNRVGKSGHFGLMTKTRVTLLDPVAAQVLAHFAQPGSNHIFDDAIGGWEGSAPVDGSILSVKHVAEAPWIISLVFPDSEAFAPVRSAEQKAMLLTTGVAMLVFGLLWLFVWYLLRPLHQLYEKVEALRRTHDQAQLSLPTSHTDEIGNLGHVFDETFKSLDQRSIALTEALEIANRANERLSIQFNRVPLAQIVWDLEFRAVEWNPAAERIFGWSAAEAIGRSAMDLIVPEDVRPYVDNVWSDVLRGLNTERYWHNDNCRKDGTRLTCEWINSPLHDREGRLTGCLSMAHDIGARKASEQQIEYLAHHDTLTGLPNRILFRNRLEYAISTAQRTNDRLALLFLDADNFKAVNDSLGHAAGDALLQGIARRLRECLRDSDTICRHGGDEFLVLLNHTAGADAVGTVANKILLSIAKPFLIAGHEVTTSFSIGVAVFPDDGEDSEELLKQADTAMYHAKAEGRNTCCFYSDQMNRDAADHLSIRNGLHHALERGEFVLHYQPQIDLITGRVVSAEALLRWSRPADSANEPAHSAHLAASSQRELINAEHFIPVAEASGLIVPIGQWVVREACRQGAAWRASGMAPLTITINLSAAQFRHGNIESTLVMELQASGLPADALELELNEAILQDEREEMRTAVQRLANLGVKLSIDDFGAGYSNLAHMRRIKAGKLKIDKGFIAGLDDDPDSSALIRAFVDMAHGLNMRTSAEGVENAAMLDMVKDCGCDEAQGYYISKPMSSQEFEVFWHASRDVTTGPEIRSRRKRRLTAVGSDN